MKVMVIVKASPSSEAGQLPSQALLEAMGQYNEELVNAGIMEFGEGLKPSSEGYRVRFKGSSREITKGPFMETNELIAGFWIWNVQSMDEALEWVKKCPNPMEEESDIEIRSFFEMDDFAEIDTTGAVRQQEDNLRNTMALQKGRVNQYLFFSGNCEDALKYYQARIGAKINFMMRFNESPDTIPEGELQPGFEDKVMHATFSLGATEIYASDGCNDSSAFAGFRTSLSVPTEEDAERIFDALAENGTVDMPLTETFFAKLYGQVTDQFGMGWMVMVDKPIQAQ